MNKNKKLKKIVQLGLLLLSCFAVHTSTAAAERIIDADLENQEEGIFRSPIQAAQVLPNQMEGVPPHLEELINRINILEREAMILEDNQFLAGLDRARNNINHEIHENIPAVIEQGPRFCRRHRRSLAASCAAVILLLSVGTFVTTLNP